MANMMIAISSACERISTRVFVQRYSVIGLRGGSAAVFFLKATKESFRLYRGRETNDSPVKAA